MRHKIKTPKTVSLDKHTGMWKLCLRNWQYVHPRTTWWRSGDEENGCITMSVSAWRKFCKDYDLPFKEL